MSFTDKKLAQAILSKSLSAIVTPNTDTKNYITQIYLTNNSLTRECYVSIYAYGTENSNVLFPKIIIEPEGSIALLKCDNIIPLLNTGESLYAKCDSDSNVVITVIGTEV